MWKKDGEGLSDRLVEGTKMFGGGSLMIWGCMTWEGVGYACKIDGNMEGDLYVQILDEELQESIKFYNKTKDDIIFQQDNDPSTLAKRPNNGFKIMNIKLWTGLHNFQTLAPLNTFGIIWKGSLQSMKFLPREFWSFGIGWRNGTRYH